jgi:hypothetical protein
MGVLGPIELKFYKGQIGSDSFIGLKQLTCLEFLAFYSCYLPNNHLEVLSHLTRLTRLTIQKPKDIFTSYSHQEIRSLSSLQNIRELNILRAESISKTEEYLNALALFPKLESLQKVPLLRSKHIELAKHMTNLQSIYIEALHMEDVAYNHLSEMTKLTRLRIIDANTTDSTNFMKISALTNLRELQMYNCNMNYDVFKKCPLVQVQLDSMELKSLEWLANCTKLKYLELFYTQVNDYNGIQYLTQLEDFSAFATGMTDPALNLIPAKSLTRLVLRSESEITIDGVHEWTLPITATSLRELDLSNSDFQHVDSEFVRSLFVSPFLQSKTSSIFS